MHRVTLFIHSFQPLFVMYMWFWWWNGVHMQKIMEWSTQFSMLWLWLYQWASFLSFSPFFSSLLHSIHNQTRALWHYPQARYKRDIFFFQFCKENSSTPLHSAIPLASFRWNNFFWSLPKKRYTYSQENGEKNACMPVHKFVFLYSAFLESCVVAVCFASKKNKVDIVVSLYYMKIPKAYMAYWRREAEAVLFMLPSYQKSIWNVYR